MDAILDFHEQVAKATPDTGLRGGRFFCTRCGLDIKDHELYPCCYYRNDGPHHSKCNGKTLILKQPCRACNGSGLVAAEAHQSDQG